TNGCLCDRPAIRNSGKRVSRTLLKLEVLQDRIVPTFLHAGDIVVSELSGEIVDIDPPSGTQTVVSTGGFLQTPLGIAVDQNGNIFVAAAGSRRIVEVDPNTGGQRIVASGGFLGQPTSVGLASDGSTFVADQEGSAPGAVI